MVFGLIMAFSYALNIDFLAFILPIIWFYSFFHTHNIASMSDEEFYALEDRFLFGIEDGQLKEFVSGNRGRKIVAIALIILGGCALWKNFQAMFYFSFADYFPNVSDTLNNIFERVPETIVSICVILFGIYLIRGKKKELDQKDSEQKEGNN